MAAPRSFCDQAAIADAIELRVLVCGGVAQLYERLLQRTGIAVPRRLKVARDLLEDLDVLDMPKRGLMRSIAQLQAVRLESNKQVAAASVVPSSGKGERALLKRLAFCH